MTKIGAMVQNSQYEHYKKREDEKFALINLNLHSFFVALEILDVYHTKRITLFNV